MRPNLWTASQQSPIKRHALFIPPIGVGNLWVLSTLVTTLYKYTPYSTLFSTTSLTFNYIYNFNYITLNYITYIYLLDLIYSKYVYRETGHTSQTRNLQIFFQAFMPPLLSGL